MNKDQKNDVIELLKSKFSQYSNFYVTNTESLTVAQVNDLRKVCFDKQVEMKPPCQNKIEQHHARDRQPFGAEGQKVLALWPPKTRQRWKGTARHGHSLARLALAFG